MNSSKPICLSTLQLFGCIYQSELGGCLRVTEGVYSDHWSLMAEATVLQGIYAADPYFCS